MQPIRHYNPYNLEFRESVSVFSARFLNRSFKRSFSSESCSDSFVAPLESDDLARLEKFISNNKEILKKFDSYKPKPIHAIYNTSVLLAGAVDQNGLDKRLAGLGELTHKEIYHYLEESDLVVSDSGINVQFLSEDHKVNDKNELLYKFSESY